MLYLLFCISNKSLELEFMVKKKLRFSLAFTITSALKFKISVFLKQKISPKKINLTLNKKIKLKIC
jgi:hypothetical protein